MNNYQLKYSKTQVFNTRFAVKDMMGSGGGGVIPPSTEELYRYMNSDGTLSEELVSIGTFIQMVQEEDEGTLNVSTFDTLPTYPFLCKTIKHDSVFNNLNTDYVKYRYDYLQEMSKRGNTKALLFYPVLINPYGSVTLSTTTENNTTITEVIVDCFTLA